MLINFDRLKVARPAIFRSAVTQLGYGRGEEIFELVLGTRDVEDSELDPELRRLLTFWVSTDKSEKPAAPVVEESALEPFASEEELLQRATDQARGFSRLQQFSDEQGLEESPSNCSLVDVWLTQRGLFWSQENVDKAVLSLKNVLTWKAKAVEPPPTPEPVEVLGTLPDGTTQLSLSDAPTNKSSVMQAKDWLARTRAATGKYSRPSGSWGSSF